MKTVPIIFDPNQSGITSTDRVVQFFLRND